MLCHEKQYFLRQDMTQKSGALSVPLGNRLTNDSNTYTYQEQYILHIAHSLCRHYKVTELMIQSCCCCHCHQMNITDKNHRCHT